MRQMFVLACGGWLAVAGTGCMSPYHADRGALFGGLAGAGVGAAVGEAVGNPLAGALVGAGVGTLSGAAIGGSLDDIEARNRAQIEAHLAQPLSPGAVTIEDVMAMSRAGVSDNLIINHIRANGTARALQSTDLITLQQARVSDAVVQALQTSPVGGRPPVMTQGPGGPPPVIIEERYVGPPPWGPPRRRRGPPPYYGPPPPAGWGVSVGGGF